MEVGMHDASDSGTMSRADVRLQMLIPRMVCAAACFIVSEIQDIALPIAVFESAGASAQPHATLNNFFCSLPFQHALKYRWMTRQLLRNIIRYLVGRVNISN